MIIHFFRRSKKIISLSLTASIVSEMLLPLASYASVNQSMLVSGNMPVAASASSMVDGYTGDFHYSVPLVTVPGPNGESVSVSANYRAGITVNQKASWLGLGWDFNPGEITRQVVNTPDDYNGVSVEQYSTYLNSNGNPYQITAMFGSIYNNEFNRNPYGGSTTNYKAGDNMTVNYNLTAGDRCNMIEQILGSGNCYNNNSSFDPTSNANYRFNKHTAPYSSLAYDKYSVSGEGIGGTIHPYHLGAIRIHPEMNAGANSEPVSTKKCQFYFQNSTTMSVNEGNITNADVVNQTTNRIHSGTFVKYFTNAEINDNNNLYSHSNPSGYLHDAPITDVSPTRRVLSDHPADVIGAFQVTTPAGITYHYSLPVYELKNLNASFDGNGAAQLLYMNSCRYATSWKLTAITGPDYEDTNSNYTADEGDTGYWIAYNYSQWSNNYEWSSQRYNAKSDALISPKLVNLITSTAVGNQYRRTNSLSFGNSQVYVLNYIRTATHTAYFVKSIRQDEQSYQVVHSYDKPVASLKLDKVVLLKNENKNLLINNISLSGADLDGRFSYTSSTGALNDVNFVNITRYNANKTAIDAAALSTAELSFNYSLAKKYTGNINNSFSGTPVAFSPFTITGYTLGTYSGSWYINNVNYVSSTTSDNGKLTLKKISMYSLQGEKILPSIDFSYDENNNAKNPDFNVDKTDLWGYYKSDYVNSHFVTAVSKDNVDAWSLKEINTSLGGKIAITYESDRYHKEGFNGDLPFYKVFTGDPTQTGEQANMPSLIFPISNINSSGHVTFYDHDIGNFLAFTNEPVSDPNYLHPMYTIYSQVAECAHPIVTYNNGNSSYYPPIYRHLIRYGNTIGSAGGSGTGPYTTILVGSQPEYNFNCPQSGYSPGTTTINNAGVNHAVIFRSYLYGGGIRVNNIKITDPFSNNSYTQKFEYGNGYCPVVPKPTDFSTHSGPSNHDVVLNMKPLIAPQLTGMVGYNSCTQYSLNQNNQATGTVTQNFHNALIAKPLTIAYSKMTVQHWPLCLRMTAQGQNCLSRPVFVPGNVQHPLCVQQVSDYKVLIDLVLNDNNLLGRLESESDGVSSTKYYYSSSTIRETYSHPKVETVNYSNQMIYPDVLPQGANYGQCPFTYDYKDEYVYNKSFVQNANIFLSATETIKDDIKITNQIKRVGYTGATYQTKTTDPTSGTYESTTEFAVFQTIPNSTARLYPLMDLKSKNETNRNLLTPVSGTKVIKDDNYIISESKATFSNSYPIRLLGGGIQNMTKPWYHLHETYQRLLDDDVLASTAPLSTDWRKESTNTLYDFSYNCIEQEGLNGRKAASRWGYAGLYKLADISNANYNSFAFSSFEDPAVGPGNNNIVYGGEITNGQTAQVASPQVVNNITYVITPHTGMRMAGIAPNGAGPSLNTKNFEVGRTYIAKVWVHKLSPPTAALSINITGTAGGAYTDTKTVTRNNPANVTVGDWVLMSVELEVPENFNTGVTHNMSLSLTNNGSTSKAYFDDLAFHPKDAVMTGNVYNEKTGAVIAQLDNDNFATFYYYDNALRLVATSKEYSGGIKKVTENSYHYSKP